MRDEVKLIVKEMESLATDRAKAAVSKFVPGSSRAIGVSMPDINKLAVKYQEGGFKLVNALCKSGVFEARMLAGKILQRIGKLDPDETLTLIEKFSKDIDNWAICDCLGSQSTQKVRKTHRNEVFSLSRKLIRSTNLWQRRLALVLLEGYTRDETARKDIEKIMEVVKNDKEYYVKKAIEWLNRNFEKKR